MPTQEVDRLDGLTQAPLIPDGSAIMSDRHSAAHSLLATSVSQEYGEGTEALRQLGQAIDVVARAVFALSTATPAKAASVMVCT